MNQPKLERKTYLQPFEQNTNDDQYSTQNTQTSGSIDDQSWEQELPDICAPCERHQMMMSHDECGRNCNNITESVKLFIVIDLRFQSICIRRYFSFKQ